MPTIKIGAYITDTYTDTRLLSLSKVYGVSFNCTYLKYRKNLGTRAAYTCIGNRHLYPYLYWYRCNPGCTSAHITTQCHSIA